MSNFRHIKVVNPGLPGGRAGTVVVAAEVAG